MNTEPTRGALPNLIVIGGQKCGTSALHYYLGLHPRVAMSRPKELDFFIDRAVPRTAATTQRVEQGPLAASSWRGNWSKGLAWYTRHFDPSMPVRGESSPNYSAPAYPYVAEKMAALIPDAKLVFMVRDPIERAISQYMHVRAYGHEQRDVNEALGDPRGRYLDRSRYHETLERYLRHFPASSILVVAQEELLRNRLETIRSVYRFAGVHESFRSPKLDRERNRSEAGGGRRRAVRRVERLVPMKLGYRLPEDVKWAIERIVGRRKVERPVLDPAVRERVADRLRSDVARLRELTQQDFADWSL